MFCQVALVWPMFEQKNHSKHATFFKLDIQPIAEVILYVNVCTSRSLILSFCCQRRIQSLHRSWVSGPAEATPFLHRPSEMDKPQHLSNERVVWLQWKPANPRTFESWTSRLACRTEPKDADHCRAPDFPSLVPWASVFKGADFKTNFLDSTRTLSVFNLALGFATWLSGRFSPEVATATQDG